VPPRSVAVLPFIDLSEGMANEEFADGITEELIDRLNKMPGLRVPAPTSTFFYKNKQVPVAEIGRSLGVAYVLDGSVRKSGERVRVGARLIRAADAAVIWSESYERPWSDLLALQDDIAGEVSRALERSLSAAPN
jgi:TolB-like protein